METHISILKCAVPGLFGLVMVMIVAAILFGKRIRKQWEFEADFRDAEGRVYVQREKLIHRADPVSAVQICRVLVGGSEIASAGFHPD